MLRLLTLIYAILLVLTTLNAATITPEKSSYAYPMEGVARLYSANFGEMRSGHFHSGVDIKSDGVEGKRIVAAADGYVSRLSVSPYGYGVSLYITHPSNGTTTQYGHLSKFRDDIEAFAQAERYRLKQHSINVFLTPTQYPVKRGDVIAYSGNTGSSSGPHLHYEIRESKQQRPLNPVTMGAIQPVDNIKPIFTRLYYIELERKNGVIYQSRVSEYEVERVSDGSYSVANDRLIWVGREGYFVVAVYDRKDNVSNKFGIYSVEMSCDGEVQYRHQQDGFLFAETRYCNSVSYYPLQRKTSIPHYRLCRQDGLPLSMLHTIKGDGIVYTEAGDEHQISVVACDDMKHSSILKFRLRGKDDADCLSAPIDESLSIARSQEATSYVGDGIKLKLSSGVLYESIPYEVSKLNDMAMFDDKITGCKSYSGEYAVFDYNTPLHRAMELSVEANIPQAESDKAVMVYVDEKGGYSAIKGKYLDGYYTASSRVAGRFFVGVDLESPTLSTSLVDGADLSGHSAIAFDMKDNLSGVVQYEATIDGEWVALDLRAGCITHRFRKPANGGEHKIEVTVQDLVGNETKLCRTFKR